MAKMYGQQKCFSRKIGEEFRYEGGNADVPHHFDLVVTEVAEPKCDGCFFHRKDLESAENPYGCRKIYAIVGDCDAGARKDKKNVIFTHKICK